MYYSRLISTTSLCAAMCGGCSNEPGFCSGEFVALTAAIVNSAGQPLSGLSVTDTVVRSGAVLDVTASSPGTSLPADGLPAAMIFNDSFIEAVLPTGDEVVVVVTAGGRSGSGRYEFGSDGCHVQKLAGPDTLVVS